MMNRYLVRRSGDLGVSVAIEEGESARAVLDRMVPPDEPPSGRKTYRRYDDHHDAASAETVSVIALNEHRVGMMRMMVQEIIDLPDDKLVDRCIQLGLLDDPGWWWMNPT